MTNEDIWRVALEQSAIDCNCRPEDFLRTENVIATANDDPRARGSSLAVAITFSVRRKSSGRQLQSMADCSSATRQISSFVMPSPHPSRGFFLICAHRRGYWAGVGLIFSITASACVTSVPGTV